MDTETLNLHLPPEPFMKSSKFVRFLDEYFVWIAIVLSVLAHFGTLFILGRDAVVVPVAQPAKVVAKVRIFSNPNGNPNSKTKQVEVSKPKPKELPKPKPDHKVINTKPVEKEQPQETTPEENSGPQSFGDDTTGGAVGEGFSNTDGQGEAGVNSNWQPAEHVDAIYPKEAATKGIEGYVELKIDVTEEGNVENVRVEKGDPRGMFDKAAKDAVRKWKYKPQIMNGKPTRINDFIVHLDFKLNG